MLMEDRILFHEWSKRNINYIALSGVAMSENILFF